MPLDIIVGNRAVVTASFANDAGTLVDPTTVTAKTCTPHGVVTTYTYPASPTLTKTSTGVYELEFDLSEVGNWEVRFVGTGALVAAGETEIDVPASRFV